MKKHILVISQYFFPEQFRINDICTEWIKRGYKVTVITGIPNYPKGKFYDGYGVFSKRKEEYNDVKIIRIPLIPRGNNSIMLALNYLSFVFSGFFWSAFTKISADLVFIFEVSPMTQALPGLWYAKRKNVPCYLYVQDLWPENIEIVAGITNKVILGSIGKMVDYIYKGCTKIFTTSWSFVESICERGIPKNKVEYWPQYAEDFYIPLCMKEVPDIPNDGWFNVIFTGNIGNAQGLEILPKTAALLKENDKKVRFNIVGDGRYKDKLIALVQSYNVTDMFNFIPKQPATRIPELLAASDAAILCLVDSPLFSKTIPAKLQSYMACGMPIIASASGETCDIINKAEAGVFCSSGDYNMLADIILKFSNKSKEEIRQAGNRARIYYNENFNKNLLLDKMDEHFNDT